MGHLLSKLYKNKKIKTTANAEEGKKLSSQRKVEEKNERVTKIETENVQVMKEPKTLPLD